MLAFLHFSITTQLTCHQLNQLLTCCQLWRNGKEPRCLLYRTMAAWFSINNPGSPKSQTFPADGMSVCENIKYLCLDLCHSNEVVWTDLTISGVSLKRLNSSQSAKHYYSSMELAEQQDVLRRADGYVSQGEEFITLLGYCGQSLVDICTAQKVLFINVYVHSSHWHTCIDTWDTPSRPASKCKCWLCISHSHFYEADF